MADPGCVQVCSDLQHADKALETFAGTIIDDTTMEKNQERQIGGNGKPEGEGPRASPVPKHLLTKAGSENTLVTLSPGIDFRPPRNNVETGYLTKAVKTPEEPPRPKPPPEGIKMSSMEEEAMRERIRMALLKQYSDYLSADGCSRYTKETFRRIFMEKVALHAPAFDIGQLPVPPPKEVKYEIKEGDALPASRLMEINPGNIIDLAEETADKKVIIFSLVCAFAPGDTNVHLQGYVNRYESFRSFGIDDIFCLVTNDVFVAAALGMAQECTGKVRILADPDATYTRALGMELEVPQLGITRSKRLAMVVKNRVVTRLAVEPDGVGITVTKAELLSVF